MVTNQRAKDYYSKNLSTLNISSYSDEMLKSSENVKLWRYSNYESPNFKDYSDVISADPPISVCYQILRIGGSGYQYILTQTHQ